MTTSRSLRAFALSLLVLSAGLLGCSGEEPAPQTPPPTPSTLGGPQAPKADVPSEQDVQPEGRQFWVAVEVDHDWGPAPYAVALNATIMGKAGVPPFTYTWEFGDGSPLATGAAVTHVYTFPGTFHAAVVIHDQQGRIAYDFAEIWVEKPGEE